MTRTLRQRQRQRHTRRQKGGGIFDFFQQKLAFDVKLDNVSGFFSRMNSRMNPFAPKTITERVVALPKQVITGVTTGVNTVTAAAAAAPQNIVNKIPGVAPKRGGTRKRKQRKQRKN